MNKIMILLLLTVSCQSWIMQSMESKSSVEDLFVAIENKNYEQVKSIVQNDQSLVDSCHNNLTPLTLAAYQNSYDITQLLIEHNADVHCKDNHNNTPLHRAIMAPLSPKLEMIKLLVEAGANVNISNQDNYTPLEKLAKPWCWMNHTNSTHAISLEPRIPIIQFLFSKGALIIHQRPSVYALLYYAIKHHNISLIQSLITVGINLQETYFGLGEINSLCAAVQYGTHKIIRMLIAAKANPNAKDLQTNSSLYYALNQGNPLFVRILLDAGATLKGKISLNNLSSYHKDILLLAGYASGLELKKKSKLSFLQAVTLGQHDQVQACFNNGEPIPDLNYQYPPHNGTLLMIAAAQGHIETLMILFKHGANPFLQGNDKAGNQFDVFDIVETILDDPHLTKDKRACYETIYQCIKQYCYNVWAFAEEATYLKKLPLPLAYLTIELVRGKKFKTFS